MRLGLTSRLPHWVIICSRVEGGWSERCWPSGGCILQAFHAIDTSRPEAGLYDSLMYRWPEGQRSSKPTSSRCWPVQPVKGRVDGLRIKATTGGWHTPLEVATPVKITAGAVILCKHVSVCIDGKTRLIAVGFRKGVGLCDIV